MIFETHAHFEDEKFDTDRVGLLSSMREKGIGNIIDVGSSIETSVKAVELSKNYDFINAAVGVHPDSVGELDEDGIRKLMDLASDPKVAAIGEIGPDFHYESDPYKREKQIYWFRRQLDMALELDLPVIVHSRDAAEMTFDIMKEYSRKGLKAVIHCYSYSADMAKSFISMGYKIGVGGVVTFKNAKKMKASVEAVPIDSILLETDCPYMAPEPHRGERNDSTLLTFVVKKISEIKNLSVAEVEDMTYENALSLFPKVRDVRLLKK